MATRSYIGYKNSDGTVNASYLHYDGYLEEAGVGLMANSTDAEAKKLGYAKGIRSIHQDGKVEFYGDMDNWKYDSEDNFYREEKGNVDYLYLYDPNRGWLFHSDKYDTRGFIELEDQLIYDELLVGSGEAPSDEDKALDIRLSEADSIPTEPGTSKRASNHDRKMALRNVIDVLKSELGVETDDALEYVTTHRDELLDGTVDPFDKDKIIDDYGEYLSVNTEYVKEEDNLDVDISDAAAGDEAIEKESGSGAFEEGLNKRGETLREQFKRLSK